MNSDTSTRRWPRRALTASWLAALPLVFLGYGLAALPAQLAWAVMASASVLALALVIRVAIAAVPYWRFPAAWSTPLLTAAMLCLVPVWRTIGFGQVNVVLMAMVAVDALAVPDWRAGPASAP